MKGEQGKPDIKPGRKQSQPSKHSSEAERRQSKAWRKRRKVKRIRIDREETLQVDASQLLTDAEFKGYEKTVVQDIRIHSDNVPFLKERYYSHADLIASAFYIVARKS